MLKRTNKGVIRLRMFVGITDSDWYTTLKGSGYDEVNFWKPGGTTNFKVLNEGELFLFKLHSPDDYIVGGGFFLKFSILPSSLAWDAFGVSNGTNSFAELVDRVYKYRNTSRYENPDPKIGCIILSAPFFFEKKDWIPIPKDWSKNIVQGKTYDTKDSIGLGLYKTIQDRLIRKEFSGQSLGDKDKNKYGPEVLIKPRIGQGAFKILITDAYKRRCAITGEKTLPVLEAAHIKPYSLDGPHEIRNGLLLRRDFHVLFDRGYLTVNDKYTVEVSKRIKEDFGNGKEYYSHHGQKLIILPDSKDYLPDSSYLDWHNQNIYLG